LSTKQLTVERKSFKIKAKETTEGIYMIKKLRYYISDSFDPYENLAIEKYLLDSTPDDCCTLYLWQNQNTVVIGRNQNPWAECNCPLLEKDGGKVARRLSGGGAVYHDICNLNFTFLCSTENFDVTRQTSVIKEACNLAGISAEVTGRNDILVDGRKFSGNAFYNSKGKSYHHGTILIDTNKEQLEKYLTPPIEKLEAKGVKSVKSRVINLSEVSPDLTCQEMLKYMISAFENVYGFPAEELISLDRDVISSAQKHIGSWEYIYGNTIPFSLALEEHFSWGHMQLLLNIKNGIIDSAQMYTDALDWNLSDTVTSTLKGCIFDSNIIKKSLSNSLPKQIAEDILSLF
jgi:lipoate-protein ligase A